MLPDIVRISAEKSEISLVMQVVRAYNEITAKRP